MTVLTTTPDLSAIKSRQQQTWSSGDFSVVASRIVLASERLAEAADLHAGWRVLDVACGNGNATLAAARHNTHAVGVDYVPHLLDDGRIRAAAEGLDVEFRDGDAEAIPFERDGFDAALSVFGVMFAPDQAKAASELIRVTRPGGTIGLASWTPEGFLGDMFRTIAGHVQPPAGLDSPMLWGTDRHLATLFADAAADIESTRQLQMFRFTSPEEFVHFFRRWYGPTVSAFAALDKSGQAELAADLAELARRWNRHDGDSVCLPGEYLETVVTLR